MVDQMKPMSLRQVARYANIPAETLDALDAELRQLRD